MDTIDIARHLLDQGPVTAGELADDASVTRRSAQRTLADLYQGGEIDRHEDGGEAIYYRARHKAEALKERPAPLGKTARRAVRGLRDGKWRTTAELREHLGCSHSLPFRVARELVERGIAREAGKAPGPGGGPPATVYEAVEEVAVCA